MHVVIKASLQDWCDSVDLWILIFWYDLQFGLLAHYLYDSSQIWIWNILLIKILQILILLIFELSIDAVLQLLVLIEEGDKRLALVCAEQRFEG